MGNKQNNVRNEILFCIEYIKRFQHTESRNGHILVKNVIYFRTFTKYNLGFLIFDVKLVVTDLFLEIDKTF